MCGGGNADDLCVRMLPERLLMDVVAAGWNHDRERGNGHQSQGEPTGAAYNGHFGERQVPGHRAVDGDAGRKTRIPAPLFGEDRGERFHRLSVAVLEGWLM